MWERLSFLSLPGFLCSFHYFSHLLLFGFLLQSAQTQIYRLSVSTFYSALPANTSSCWPSSQIYTVSYLTSLYLLSLLLKHVFS